MARPFASSADVEQKRSTLEELAPGVVAYTAEGDPNVGAVIGEDAVLAIDARATPSSARAWLDQLHRLTEKPVRYLVLTHYHAVRVLGASAFAADLVIAHDSTRRWIHERGAADFESETRRFPRLFEDVDSIPGLTYPNVSFADSLRLDLGGRDVQLLHLGRGHTEGDTAVWLPDDKILFAGDLVEAHAAPYMGDACVDEWSTTTLDRVEALGATQIVPGRGAAAGPEAIAETRDYLRTLWETVRAGHEPMKQAFDAARAALAPRFGDWWIFEHCLPFNVARAWDEANGIGEPQVWTAEKDAAVWTELQS